MKRFLLLLLLGCCFVFCRKNRQVNVELLAPQQPVVSEQTPAPPPPVVPPPAPDPAPEPPATPSKKLRQVKLNGTLWMTLFYNTENRVDRIEYSGLTKPGAPFYLRQGERMTDEIIYENERIKRVNSYRGMGVGKTEYAYTVYSYTQGLVTQMAMYNKKSDGIFGLYGKIVYKNREAKQYNVVEKQIYNSSDKLRERVVITYTADNGSRIEKIYDDLGDLREENRYENDDKIGYGQYLLDAPLDDYPLPYQHKHNTLSFTDKKKFGAPGSRKFTFTYDKEGYPIQCNEVAVAAIIGFTKTFVYDFVWE